MRGRLSGACLAVLLALNLACLFAAAPARADWTSIGPNGAYIGSLAADPSNANILYAGTDRGMFKSSDAGVSWTASGSGMPRVYVRQVAVDPLHPQTLYALAGNRLFKSKNGGASWRRTASVSDKTLIICFAVDPQRPNVLYAGWFADFASRGLRKSTDGGATWTSLPSPLLSLTCIAVDPGNSRTLFIGSEEGKVYKSTDGGMTWIKASTGLAASWVSALVIDSRNPRTLYAANWYGDVFKSTNGGVTWSGLGLKEQIFTLVMDPQDSLTLYAASSGKVFKSTNGGAAWRTIDLRSSCTLILALAVSPQSRKMVFAGSDGGVLKSTDSGVRWRSACSGLTNTHIRAFALAPRDPKTLYAGYAEINGGQLGGGSGVRKSTDRGTTWARSGLAGYTLSALAVDPQNPEILYAATDRYVVFKSVDGGASWTETGLKNATIVSFAIVPQATQIVYAKTYNEIYKSTDGGVSWSSADAGIRGNTIWSLAIDPRNPQTLYAAIVPYGGSYPNYYGEIYKSMDGGASWHTTGFSLPKTRITQLVLDPHGTIYAATDDPLIEFPEHYGGVFKSTDGGVSWSSASLGLAGNVITALAIDPKQTQTLYGGTADGDVLKSADGGASWSFAGTCVKGIRIGTIAINPWNPQLVYAATDGGGVFRSTDGGGQ